MYVKEKINNKINKWRLAGSLPSFIFSFLVLLGITTIPPIRNNPDDVGIVDSAISTPLESVLKKAAISETVIKESAPKYVDISYLSTGTAVEVFFQKGDTVRVKLPDDSETSIQSDEDR